MCLTVQILVRRRLTSILYRLTSILYQGTLTGLLLQLELALYRYGSGARASEPNENPHWEVTCGLGEPPSVYNREVTVLGGRVSMTRI